MLVNVDQQAEHILRNGKRMNEGELTNDAPEDGELRFLRKAGLRGLWRRHSSHHRLRWRAISEYMRESGAVVAEGTVRTDLQARRMKDLEIENQRLRRAISDLTLNKLIPQETARGNF